MSCLRSGPFVDILGPPPRDHISCRTPPKLDTEMSPVCVMSTSECQRLITIVGSADDDDNHALTHTAGLSVLQSKKKHWTPDGVKYGPGRWVGGRGGGSGEVDLWVTKYKTCRHWHYGIQGVFNAKSASYTFNLRLRAACVNVDDCLEKTQGANDSGSCFPVL